MNWEELEALYWRFDAMHKGYGDWHGKPTSERDAFKRTVKQALAEKDALIERLKALSWNENVKFIAEAKENLLNEYIHLTELYGEQKHEIRKLKAAEVEKDREIATLKHEYAQLKEAYDAKAAGVPLGPIVGAQTITNQQIAYQQLMEKAVLFALCLKGCPSPCVDGDLDDCMIQKAKAFLKEREEM